jgi:hypothetical protein
MAQCAVADIRDDFYVGVGMLRETERLALFHDIGDRSPRLLVAPCQSTAASRVAAYLFARVPTAAPAPDAAEVMSGLDRLTTITTIYGRGAFSRLLCQIRSFGEAG